MATVISEGSPLSPGEKFIQEMRDRGECVTSMLFDLSKAGTNVVPVMVDAYVAPATQATPEPKDPSMPDG
ncbi:MAG: hypothetical protein ACAH17_01635 [Candidatus Paceibacterota bacterium]